MLYPVFALNDAPVIYLLTQYGTTIRKSQKPAFLTYYSNYYAETLSNLIVDKINSLSIT